jgi:hypothetical protein
MNDIDIQILTNSYLWSEDDHLWSKHTVYSKVKLSLCSAN